MTEQKSQPKKISKKSTKQEMLEAYDAVLQQLKEKKEMELSPEKKVEERKTEEVVHVADSLSSEGVLKEITTLKVDIGKMLGQISDGLEEEVAKYNKIRKAIEAKEKDLNDLYEIERSAATLAALMESQNQSRQQFESEMALKKEELVRETEVTRARWDKEKKEHEAVMKERNEAEQKRREREREEFQYAFKREQQLAKDRFEDGKTKLEMEIQLKKEQIEKELEEREKVVSEKENEFEELRKKVSAFPQEIQAAVSKATKEISEAVQLEAKNREDLMEKTFDGEKNVLTTRIESFGKTVKEQSEQIGRLTQQLDRAYQKVQDMAVKAIEGSSEGKSLATIQQLISEQARRQTQEK